ncbi:MAG: ATP synthase F1 subunit gamma [Luteitalea sp.]|nr:ATP synthase F1 subunit gamma [Luteitalea sp.]
MPSLIDIRRRVRAVRATQQITKAMKMVAASRLRRAQERVVNARPYAQRMAHVLNGLAARVEPGRHPLLGGLDAIGDAPTLLVVVSADKGLCGSFNSNVTKAASSFVREQQGRAVAFALVGRKGRDYFRRRRVDIRYECAQIFGRLKLDHARQIARVVIEQFVEARAGRVCLAYNEFKTVMQQRVVVEQLLPIPRGAGTEAGNAPPGDYLYEPSADEILARLLPQYVEVQIFRALLESEAAEHAARMTAMDAASRNAADMIDDLTLYMNKVRQAAITREIIEVVSGART